MKFISIFLITFSCNLFAWTTSCRNHNLLQSILLSDNILIANIKDSSFKESESDLISNLKGKKVSGSFKFSRTPSDIYAARPKIGKGERILFLKRFGDSLSTNSCENYAEIPIQNDSVYIQNRFFNWYEVLKIENLDGEYMRVHLGVDVLNNIFGNPRLHNLNNNEQVFGYSFSLKNFIDALNFVLNSTTFKNNKLTITTPLEYTNEGLLRTAFIYWIEEKARIDNKRSDY